MIMLFPTDVGGNRVVGGIVSISPMINLGVPQATITWARNGEVINPEDPRVVISNDSGAIVVVDVRASDRGVYMVTATNSAAPDGVMASADVFITCKFECTILNVEAWWCAVVPAYYEIVTVTLKPESFPSLSVANCTKA